MTSSEERASAEAEAEGSRLPHREVADALRAPPSFLLRGVKQPSSALEQILGGAAFRLAEQRVVIGRYVKRLQNAMTSSGGRTSAEAENSRLANYMYRTERSQVGWIPSPPLLKGTTQPISDLEQFIGRKGGLFLLLSHGLPHREGTDGLRRPPF